MQATRQVTRAAIEWYGPDRPKFLGKFLELSASFRQKQFGTAVQDVSQPCTAFHIIYIACYYNIEAKI